MMAIILSVYCMGFKGKTVDFEKCSSCHRTSIAHFLNHGKWDDDLLESIIKQAVLSIIYQEARRTGSPVFCIVDDTISSHTKPSSQAKHPMEDTYFHQSHLKKKQDFGYQAVAVMLSCNGIVLNYAIIMYDKSQSKIALELPVPPVISYFLCDSWYTTEKLYTAFVKKGFYMIGALKTNRIIFPCGIRQNISEFAQHIRKEDCDVNLVTVGIRRYWRLMSLVYLMCCTQTGKLCSFAEGYASFKQAVYEEQISYIYYCGAKNIPLETILSLVA